MQQKTSGTGMDVESTSGTARDERAERVSFDREYAGAGWGVRIHLSAETLESRLAALRRTREENEVPR